MNERTTAHDKQPIPERTPERVVPLEWADAYGEHVRELPPTQRVIRIPSMHFGRMFTQQEMADHYRKDDEVGRHVFLTVYVESKMEEASEEGREPSDQEIIDELVGELKEATKQIKERGNVQT